MRFLFCSEFFYPSIGGVQEVMRHIAERLVNEGHEVTVATSWIEHRDFHVHNGVKIEEFKVAGNHVRGIAGEVERYQAYISAFDGDAILIKAAQQWTFDASWDVLDEINVRKVFIPCGFSGLYEPSYKSYFKKMPEILRKFDHLIFYAEHYRDVDFAREHGIDHFSIIPNGACELEFDADLDASFRKRNHISEDAFLLLTVGSFTGMKGHRELIDAMSHLNKKKQDVVLILNGNQPPAASVQVDETVEIKAGKKNESRIFKLLSLSKRGFKRIFGLAGRSFGVLRREGLSGVIGRFILISNQYSPRLNAFVGRLFPEVAIKAKSMFDVIDEVNGSGNAKVQIKVMDLPRSELIQAYKSANLFVFASNIEYSPLVLFESAAAGTPFLTVPVGNSKEIAQWTGAGIICPADKDEFGYTRVDPEVLSNEILNCIEHYADVYQLGVNGHTAWKEKYTWGKIAKRYESVLLGSK